MGEDEKVRSPKEIAEREVNKRLGAAIAQRKIEIKKHQAAIKKLEKEIAKIESGELVPDGSSYEDSDGIKKCIGGGSIFTTPNNNPYTSPFRKEPCGRPYSYTWSSSTTSNRR